MRSVLGGNSPRKMKGRGANDTLKNDDVIQALLPDRADHALEVSVLPR